MGFGVYWKCGAPWSVVLGHREAEGWGDEDSEGPEEPDVRIWATLLRKPGRWAVYLGTGVHEDSERHGGSKRSLRKGKGSGAKRLQFGLLSPPERTVVSSSLGDDVREEPFTVFFGSWEDLGLTLFVFAGTKQPQPYPR
jgi:hypothetical protein